MKGGGLVIAFAAAVAASAGAWTLIPNRAVPHSDRPASLKPNPAKVANIEGRMFLTEAQIHQALASGTIDRPVKSLLAVPARLQFGDFSWNDSGVPAGSAWIRVDLSRQIISIFRAGHEIGTAVIVYGGDNKETPAGNLHILGKVRDHTSSLYDAKMPYTLRLTDDGVSIHASSVRWGAATHGCIGVPLPFAKRLFDATRVGDEVVIVGTPVKKRTV